MKKHFFLLICVITSSLQSMNIAIGYEALRGRVTVDDIKRRRHRLKNCYDSRMGMNFVRSSVYEAQEAGLFFAKNEDEQLIDEVIYSLEILKDDLLFESNHLLFISQEDRSYWVRKIDTLRTNFSNTILAIRCKEQIVS